jgi:hypothetical protein
MKNKKMDKDSTICSRMEKIAESAVHKHTNSLEDVFPTKSCELASCQHLLDQNRVPTVDQSKSHV